MHRFIIDVYVNPAYRPILDCIKQHMWNGKRTIKYEDFVDGDLAARMGHLALIKMKHERNEVMKFSHWAVDSAASAGKLDVVIWLTENTTIKATKWAMDMAAKNGYFHVVRWLYEHRSEGCTAMAFEFAVHNGDIQMIRWMLINDFDRNMCRAIRVATENHRNDILDLLKDYMDE